MTAFSDILNQVLPILLLIFIGNRIRTYGFLSEKTIAELTKLVVNIALPAVLFLSFSVIELRWSYLTLSIVIFLSCILLLLAGFFFQTTIAPNHPYFPHLTSGFEYGMLGVSLFGTAYGIQDIGYIAVVDLGHELYIWFVLAPLLLALRSSNGSAGKLIRTFVTNPVVLSIMAGLGLNLLGIGRNIANWPILGGVVNTLQFLAEMVIPLILLIVGYGMRIRIDTIGETVRLIAFRYTLIIPLVLVLNFVVIRGWLGLEKPFEIALTTLFLLPSPFIIPLFMRPDMDEEKEYVNNILATQTAITICLFTLFLLFFPKL